MDGEVKNSLDLNVRVELNRVTSTTRNQKERAYASAPLSLTDFNGYRDSGGGYSTCSCYYYYYYYYCYL
jgi:hypothetical protein